MRKTICLMICLSMLLAFCLPVTVGAYKRADDTEMLGLSVSPEDFGALFSGNPKTRTAISVDCITESRLGVKDICITDKGVSLVVQLQNENQQLCLDIAGTFASSFKAENGINSIIVEVDSEVSGYKVLLFEIFNDTQEDILLLESVNYIDSLQGIPHMKLYLQDAQEQLHIFETPLPDCFYGLDAIDYPRASNEKDALLWATDFVVHNTAIIDDIDEDDVLANSSGRALYSDTIMEYGQWFYDSYYIASQLVESYSKPYIEFYHADVYGGSNAPWYVRFKVEEYTLTQGYVVYGQTAYRYVNVKLGFGTGDNTTINSYRHQGQMKKELNGIDAIISSSATFVAGVLENSISSLPYGSTFQSALQCLLAVTPVNRTITFGSEYDRLSMGFCSAYGVDLSDYYFQEDTNHSSSKSALGDYGHYFILQIYPIYWSQSSYTQTKGALYVHFDVEIANEISSSYPPFVSELSYDFNP